MSDIVIKPGQLPEGKKKEELKKQLLELFKKAYGENITLSATAKHNSNVSRKIVLSGTREFVNFIKQRDDVTNIELGHVLLRGNPMTSNGNELGYQFTYYVNEVYTFDMFVNDVLQYIDEIKPIPMTLDDIKLTDNG